MGADQVAVRAFAQGVEGCKARGVQNSAARFAPGDLGFDQPLQRLHQPAAQGLAAEEHPFLEFGTIRQREAGEIVAGVEAGGIVEKTGIAGMVEGPGVGLDEQRRAHHERCPLADMTSSPKAMRIL